MEASLGYSDGNRRGIAGRMSWQSRGKTAWRQQETAGGVKGKQSVPRTDDGAQAEAEAWWGTAAPAMWQPCVGSLGARRVGGEARLE